MKCPACGGPNMQITFDDALECLDCRYWVRVSEPEDLQDEGEEDEETPMDYCQ